MNYGEALNPPKPDFPMRGELPEREPEIQKMWEEREIYRKSLEKPAPGGDFVLHDVPPYSNGRLYRRGTQCIVDEACEGR